MYSYARNICPAISWLYRMFLSLYNARIITLLAYKIMPTHSFSKDCLQALDEIEDAHVNGHLLYFKEYIKKHDKELTSQRARIMIEFGLTTHKDLFTQYYGDRRANPIMCFRLKPKVSASQALRALLTSGETVIDCGASLILVHIYACLLALEDKYGLKYGQLRFDLLFGSAIHETPVIQRLLFSNNSVVSGTKGYIVDVANNTSPLNPFSFLFGFSALVYEVNRTHAPGVKIDEKKYINKCNVGSILCMQGNENYDSKHPAGSDANYNCIYVGNDKYTKPLFRVFGHGKEPVSELALKEKHVLLYNQGRDDDDKYCSSFIPAPAYPEQITLKDVPGISVLSNIDVKADIWEMFLSEPLPILISKLRQDLNHKLIARNGAMLEDSQLLPPVMVNTYYFPANLNNEQSKLLLFLGAKNKKCTNSGLVKMELESSFLDKSVRDQVGLERKITKKLTPKELDILKSFYPEATIETLEDKNRGLITVPKMFYPQVEKIITKLHVVEAKITLVQKVVKNRLNPRLQN